ncbi:hypothetical protein COHA_010150 [Chlorella ohadii]|uniref:Uncharacterized protein n=1 Tax=Chlorella ohadii TaxID=2649997 RepID=A0AAD5DGW6_9CHLO|nr:hypothetical protein COHA_010150 [Chlorella ohadii]
MASCTRVLSVQPALTAGSAIHSKPCARAALLQRPQCPRQQRRAAVAAALSEEQQGGRAQDVQQPAVAASSNGAEAEDDSRDFAVAMAKIAWETKAEDILLLHVAPVVYWTRYMLICSVFSRPQLNAVLGKMTKEAAEVHGRRLSVNPTGTAGGWELMDWGDVVVHVMTTEQREYYALEDFYGAAEEVSLPFDQSDEAAAVDSWSKKL